MASKGQKFKKYGISEKTISTWQQKLRPPEKYQNLGLKRGRQKEKNNFFSF